MTNTRCPERLTRYLEVLLCLPMNMRNPGSIERGEIVLITDWREMLEVEADCRRDYAKRGLNLDDANIGILYEDGIKWHINDAWRIVKPDGTVIRRGWDRIIWKNGVIGKSVIVVPITPDGRVIMVPAYRHLAGRWELELPGGGAMNAKTHRECVKFELLEEAGYTAGEIIPLEPEVDGIPVAFFCPDTSTQVTPLQTFAVRVVEKVDAQPEVGEVFGKAMLFTLAQIKELFTRGYVEHPAFPGVRCYPQDGRNGYGLLLAILRGLIK